MSWLKIFALSLTTVALNGAPQQAVSSKAQVAGKKTEVFKPFTGKVLANKVRIRTEPDLDSHIFRQVDKNELLLIVGENSDFYAVQPPKNTKAYIFRSYILDNIIEASRVNVLARRIFYKALRSCARAKRFARDKAQRVRRRIKYVSRDAALCVGPLCIVALVRHVGKFAL